MELVGYRGIRWIIIYSRQLYQSPGLVGLARTDIVGHLGIGNQSVPLFPGSQTVFMETSVDIIKYFTADGGHWVLYWLDCAQILTRHSPCSNPIPVVTIMLSSTTKHSVIH